MRDEDRPYRKDGGIRWRQEWPVGVGKARLRFRLDPRIRRKPSNHHTSAHRLGGVISTNRRDAMRVRILLRIMDADGAPGSTEEIANFGKCAGRAEDLGQSLAESKVPLAVAQQPIVEA